MTGTARGSITERALFNNRTPVVERQTQVRDALEKLCGRKGEGTEPLRLAVTVQQPQVNCWIINLKQVILHALMGMQRRIPGFMEYPKVPQK